MSNFIIFLIKHQFIPTNKLIIRLWKKLTRLKYLIFILEQADLYKYRALAALYLGELQDKSAIPPLFKSIYDKISVVSLSAISALQKYPDYDNIIDKDLLNQKILEKKQYWIENYGLKKIKLLKLREKVVL